MRPSARRRGHATRAVQLILPLCEELGIDPVLITCDVDNIGSRTVIESCGGVYEDTREGKLRFWVPVAQENVGLARNPAAPSATATISQASISTGAEPTI